MFNKPVCAWACVLLFCFNVTKSPAKERTNLRDTTYIASVKKSTSKRIDTISLSRKEKELASSQIQELLHNQLSPLRKQMRENHNTHVKTFINKYTNPAFRAHLSKMKGLADYYFPIFDKVFNETRVPAEIKYLAIVESSLNPHAVSRVGATGPWQFMYATAKGYGLKMDAYVDERKDPIEATYAAARYLKQAYEINGDWFLAIASYNCGQGNVNRAIKRSGKTNPTFWDILPYLPRETRNYVPAFIAMSHVMDNPDIYPIEASVTDLPDAIDVIFVDRRLPLNAVAQTIGIEPADLFRLNPSYKKQVINGSALNPGRLIVPKVKKQDYAKLYAFLQGKENYTEALAAQEVQKKAPIKEQTYIAYRVRKGDTLEAITKRFKGSSVSSLRAMNNLKGSLIKPGMTLKVSQD